MFRWMHFATISFLSVFQTACTEPTKGIQPPPKFGDSAPTKLLGKKGSGIEVPPSTSKKTKSRERRESASNAIGIKMIRVPSGRFTMAGCMVVGCPKDNPGTEKDESLDCVSSRADCQGGRGEVAHEVTLTRSFFLSKTEVTQKQWQTVMGSNPSKFSTKKLGYVSDRNPVESITWLDAALFTNALSQKDSLPPCYDGQGRVTGSGSIYDCRGYRLPTEAEWEYAARANTRGARYGKLETVAWYYGNGGKTTHPVGKKSPNAFGLHDMLGNVWEWCHDWYGPYASGPQTDPVGPQSGSFRVYRGASWFSSTNVARAAFRFLFKPSYTIDSYGFRLARTVPAE